MARVGVLLMNLGGPERIQDVGPFLYNLFSDPEIIRLPNSALQKPMAWFISTLSNIVYKNLCLARSRTVVPSTTVQFL